LPARSSARAAATGSSAFNVDGSVGSEK
jgi:hypothetical protein